MGFRVNYTIDGETKSGYVKGARRNVTCAVVRIKDHDAEADRLHDEIVDLEADLAVYKRAIVDGSIRFNIYFDQVGEHVFPMLSIYVTNDWQNTRSVTRNSGYHDYDRDHEIFLTTGFKYENRETFSPLDTDADLLAEMNVAGKIWRAAIVGLSEKIDNAEKGIRQREAKIKSLRDRSEQGETTSIEFLYAAKDEKTATKWISENTYDDGESKVIVVPAEIFTQTPRYA